MSESAKTWQEIHQRHEFGRWPPESIVAYFCRRWPITERRRVRVLDLGCGTGACTRFLVDEGFIVTALDCSSDALTRLHYNLRRWELPKVEMVCHDLANPLPFPDGSFDVVLDNLTLCHVEPAMRMGVCEQIGRILVAGGTFIARRFNVRCAEIFDRGYVDYKSLCVPDEFRAITGTLTPECDSWDEQCRSIHITGMAIKKCA